MRQFCFWKTNFFLSKEAEERTESTGSGGTSKEGRLAQLDAGSFSLSLEVVEMWWKSDGIRHLRTARLLLFMLLFRRAACQQVFFDTTLAYEPAAVRVPSQLTLSLRVDSETGIRKPARVVLHLPGFVLPGATDETQVELGGEGASYFELQAVWSPTSEYLILKLNHTDTALKNQTLSLLLVDYFRLPETGLSKNSPDLMLALSRDRKDVLGDLSWAAFRQSPAVGSFYNAGSPTELTWRKDQTRPSFQAGQAATVILHFYGHMRFFRGDSVTVTLPGNVEKLCRAIMLWLVF